MKKFTLSVIAATLALGVTTQASAAIGSRDSRGNYADGTSSIRVGASTSKAHGGVGEPAVGVGTLYHGTLVRIDGFVTSTYKDINGVAPISAQIAGMPASHSGMGVFNFAQVASDPVYFGEWSATGAATDPSHTAFYSGKEVTTNMPVAGIATYTVRGVNQYNGSNLLKGELTADFGALTLSGSISNADLTLSIDNAKIENATFAGHATANGVAGNTNGHFFGDGATALAGVASFATDHAKDTAFGGTKN